MSEDGRLTPALVAAFRRVLLAMDAKRRIGERVHLVLGVLKAFSLHLPDGAQIHIDVDAVPGPADSGHLPSDLAALFVELGHVAADHDSGVLLTIDELHYVDVATLTTLIVGLHRATQLRLPVTVAGAGLPSLAAVTGDAKTYAERMFSFSQLGPLPADLAAEALVLPAADEDVAWDDRALEAVCRVTACYPYFIQEFGKAAWDVADGPDAITVGDVSRAIPLAIAQLDDGFFRVRVSRCSDGERRYLRAMAELADSVTESRLVADLLATTTQALAPIRDNLMRKALCYSPRRGQIAFTVPHFGQFMRRWMPSV